MGTDIFEHYEVREGGRWVEKDFRPSADWDRMTEDERLAHSNHPTRLHRNYALFAVLASVGHAFDPDNPDSDENYRPIALPRGLPEDVSCKVWEASRTLLDSPDGFHPSWLTLRELLEYDWEQRVTRHAVVDAVEYARFRHEGRPKNWSDGVYGPEVLSTRAEMDALLEREPHLVRLSHERHSIWHRAASDGQVYVTELRWQQSYAEAVSPFVQETLPFLKAQVENSDDLRMVCWFGH